MVKHQLGPHLAGLMARHHTQATGADGGSEGILAENKCMCQRMNVAVEVFYLRAHKELRASPLKPNVSTCMRSEKSLSFDVWCFNAAEQTEEVSLNQILD